MKDLYTENSKTLMQETEEDTNKWTDILCSRIGRINIIKIPYYPKQSTDSMQSSVKIPTAFFSEIEKII